MALGAALLPDLDGMAPWARAAGAGGIGPLHSLAGGLLVALLVGAAGSIAFPRGTRRQAWLFAGMGVALHLLADLLTHWRLPLLWPLSEEGWGLGWLHPRDLWLWILLGAPLAHAWLRRRMGLAARRAVSVPLLVCLYVSICAVAKGRAVRTALAAEWGTEERPLEVQAFPAPFGPFLWTTLVRTDSQLWHRGVVSVISGGMTRVGSHPTGEADPRMQVALATEPGRSFLRRSRALFLAEASPVGDDGSYEVAVGDLRFSDPFSDELPWVLWIRVGPDFAAKEWALYAIPHQQP